MGTKETRTEYVDQRGHEWALVQEIGDHGLHLRLVTPGGAVCDLKRKKDTARKPRKHEPAPDDVPLWGEGEIQ